MNETFAIIWVISGIVSALIVFLYIKIGHPQAMRIMTTVWTLTALWSGVIGLILYFKIGISNGMNMDEKGMKMMNMGEMNIKTDMNSMRTEQPFWHKVALSTLHCGAGCSLADIIGEWLVFFFPVIILGTGLTGQWILDYILALIIGIISIRSY